MNIHIQPGSLGHRAFFTKQPENEANKVTVLEVFVTCVQCQYLFFALSAFTAATQRAMVGEARLMESVM